MNHRLLLPNLLRWYDAHGRDLPWRKTRNAYRILISEVMLQQTQVERVKVSYANWLKQFPDWKTLAESSASEVIRAWSGLGYNRRALALCSIAQTIARDGMPTTREAWLRLKGIGPYTSAAVACFSFGERVLPIDTNVRRVLGRAYLGISFPQLKDDPRIERVFAATWMTASRYQDVPQALFDLANLVCKKTPDCQNCPLRSQCMSAEKFLAGRVRVPKRSIKKQREKIHGGKPFPDRIYRGRIVQLACEHRDVTLKNLGTCIDEQFDEKRDAEWLARMLDRLEQDGLIVREGKRMRLA